MLRNIDMGEISDNKLYTSDSLVKIECNDCNGCCKCCHDMGTSITLDPFDIYNMCKITKTSFQELLNTYIELNIVDGITLPNIKMSTKSNSCAFLNENGRCSIHENRPGICRLFPLGRIYDNNSFMYFNQINECNYPNRTKIKIKKWIGIANIKEYESYINSYHYFLKDMEEFIFECNDEVQIRTLNLLILKTFFIDEYDDKTEFYSQFYKRLENISKTLELA